MKVENKTKIEKNIKKEVKNFSKNLNQESLMRLPNISNEHKNNKKIPYEIGDIVFHSTFGNGVVKSILENENAAKVNILFGDVLRTFNSSLLKLTKIS